MRYFRADVLTEALYRGLADNTVGRVIDSMLRRTEVVVLDELGYVPFDQTAGNHFFRFIATAYETRSLVLSSNDSVRLKEARENRERHTGGDPGGRRPAVISGSGSTPTSTATSGGRPAGAGVVTAWRPACTLTLAMAVLRTIVIAPERRVWVTPRACRRGPQPMSSATISAAGATLRTAPTPCPA